MSAPSDGTTVTERIGRYEVVGQLAIGGMASILLGRLVGPRGFEHPVVIKRILPHLARVPEFVDMFVDEARIVAGIRHPNVVTVHELGREGDELFLVMEYLEGESIGGLMRRLLARSEELDRTLAAHVVAEACAGLHAAHELCDEDGRRRGLVHRDVSPQNVLVTYAGGVKVLDFGIAKAADRSTKTEAGQVKGKFEYMSPEQCSSKPLDRRSDVFALGIVLYELTTGRRLFKRESELATLKAICEQPVTPPSEVVPGYPPCLQEICMRALARRAADRYPTAAEMRRDLLGALRELGAEAMPEEALARLMRRVFADRIDEKREMLRKVKAGSQLSHIPPAETDGSVDIPIADDGSVIRSTSDLHTIEPASRDPRRWLVPLAVAAVGAAAVVATAWTQRAPIPRDEPPAVAAPPASIPAPAPAVEAPPTEIVLHVETKPPGARVSIAGEERGTTPADVRIARGTAAVELLIEREGFAPITQHVVPDVDQRLVLGMSPAARGRPRPAPKATATADDGYHRFQ